MRFIEVQSVATIMGITSAFVILSIETEAKASKDPKTESSPIIKCESPWYRIPFFGGLAQNRGFARSEHEFHVKSKSEVFLNEARVSVETRDSNGKISKQYYTLDNPEFIYCLPFSTTCGSEPSAEMSEKRLAGFGAKNGDGNQYDISINLTFAYDGIEHSKKGIQTIKSPLVQMFFGTFDKARAEFVVEQGCTPVQ